MWFFIAYPIVVFIVLFILFETVLRPQEGAGWPDIPPPRRDGVGPRQRGSDRPAPKPVPPPGAKKD